jgi:hypothetical protein
MSAGPWPNAASARRTPLAEATSRGPGMHSRNFKATFLDAA